ncbi:outer membrane beta-barrel protein [Sphingobacterium sp. DK4209]|uniref:Outer membrane beta-barrel protein n=1 Tax=Sphingobacterium zhuxiongii TaxID=2662364 RepID=A0A5Q0QHH1_9SPHI|nr:MULTISPECIES: porin family protein [unclassified Sphingobacterium]MVZ65997.1 outer membrane beta-barrel protein [Sphingobacterium sp. DK4209]QGA27548.1 outer membrane beta-barrel protein [Sphingobacterium sp. dk4302]
MKKIILAFAALFLMVQASQAQLLPSFKLGVKGALNFSSLKSEGKWLNSDTKTGYQLGVWGRVGIAGFHVQPELYYSQKTAGFDPESESENGEVTLKSMDLPILLGTRIGLGPLGVRLQAGPVFSFAQDGKVDLKSATDFENYKKSSTGIIGGIGADIRNITIDLRYEHGLNNVSTKSDQNQKISMWSIGVGYAFL